MTQTPNPYVPSTEDVARVPALVDKQVSRALVDAMNTGANAAQFIAAARAAMEQVAGVYDAEVSVDGNLIPWSARINDNGNVLPFHGLQRVSAEVAEMLNADNNPKGSDHE